VPQAAIAAATKASSIRCSSALQRGDARRTLGHRQRVVGPPLNLAHDEGKHSIGKQRGQQGQRITGVLGDVSR